MDGPGSSELVPITTGEIGACTCENCYGYLCNDCALDDLSTTPDSCHTFGFYNPNANIDTCSADGSTLCNNNDDCAGVTNLCNTSCVYPLPGCLDSGENQGGACTQAIYIYPCVTHVDIFCVYVAMFCCYCVFAFLNNAYKEYYKW